MSSPVRRTPVLVGCMLAMGTVALDSTILATAVPSIVEELGGFSAYPWIFSVNFLAQAVSIPMFGKMTDAWGRRPVLLLGAALFLFGAVLSSFSWDMYALIAFRGVQGLGAGAIQPVTQTIVGDLYQVHERARPQGLMSSVWGISAVVGPGVGGLLADYADWRWIFYLDLPVGLAAAAVIASFLREPQADHRSRTRSPADVHGAILLVAGVGLLITGLLQSNVAWPLASFQTLALACFSTVLLVLFVRRERHAADPIVPPWVLHNPAVAGVSAQALVIGMLIIGTAAYVPTFVQGAMGTTAVVAGFALTVQSFGWPFASAASARLYMRIGFRGAAASGSATTVVACTALALIPTQASVIYVMACSFVLGIGLGLQMTPLLVGVQHAVAWDRRGVITGVFVFARTMGSALGAAFFGSLSHSAGVHASGSELFASSRRVFIGLAVAACIGLAAALLTPHFGPRDTHSRTSAHRRRMLVKLLRRLRHGRTVEQE